MTRDMLKQMYGQPPERFQTRIVHTLRQTVYAPQKRRVRKRTVLLVAMILLLLTAAAYAAFYSQGIALFGKLQGAVMETWLRQGELDDTRQSKEMDGVQFTLDEVIYRNNGLFGVGTIRPAANANVVLLPVDHTPDEPYGYDVYGESGAPEMAPDGTPTIADVAEEKGATLLVAHILPQEVGVDGGTMLGLPEVGYTMAPQRDGSIRYTFEMTDAYAVEEGQIYTLQLRMMVCPMQPDGTVLETSRHRQSWTVQIRPTPIQAKP